MSNRRTQTLKVIKIHEGNIDETFDSLAVEEPLEIQIEFGAEKDRRKEAISITMRTPRNDADLAIGFLFTEGIVSDFSQIKSVGPSDEEKNMNSILVKLESDVEVDFKKLERHFYTSSSCGVCGKSSIEAVRMNNFPTLRKRHPMLKAAKINSLPIALKDQQSIFSKTGGLHAAALMDVDGKIHLIREDVGRHNAVDKLIGAALAQGMFPMNDFLILLSGRVSFELVQKSLMGGIPILAAVGAPSSLAVELAEEFGMTILGFVRKQRFNIYSGKERIILKNAD